MTSEVGSGSKLQLDMRVPLPTIIMAAVFILGQTWWIATTISSFSYRLAAVEENQKGAQPQAAQIAVMQEKLTTMQGTLAKIESWVSSLRSTEQRH